MAVEQQRVVSETKMRWMGALLSSWRQSLMLIIGLVGFGWLALYNLNYNPAPWFDEGEHLRVSKTLVQYGQYAVWSADGFRYFGPTIGVGPTVLLPIALSFKLFGVGLVQGRIVVVAYLVLALGIYWLWSTRLGGSKQAGFLAILLLCAVPGIDFTTLGRQGLGEIPALSFFLAGLLAWWKAGQQPKPGWKWIALAGTLWALAAITKSNYGLLLPPALVVAWVANRFYYRRAEWTWQMFCLPLGMTIGGLTGWYFIILLFLGGGDFSSNLALLRTASGGSAFVFSPSRMLGALKVLFGPENFFGLPILSLFYGLWLTRQNKAAHFGLLLPLSFCMVWLGWFVFASVGWPRYAFPMLALCPLFLARLVHDSPDILAAVFKQPARRRQFSIGIVLATVLVVGWGLSRPAFEILTVHDEAAQLARYLNQNVSHSALVETWESELGFLTNHRYHYPPPELLDKAVRRKWLNATGPTVAELYQPEKLNPDYLISGAFAQWNELYPAQLLIDRYQLIQSFGSYNLYRRIK